ncbi:hypothetical protein ECP_3786 [Escherichia coli 536]|uniref:Uncharacterized protein n=1 Tax=Escherichia coli O6:K15:H31 (strain 536 / UPEC) TaxID=362663 RepID=A0A454A9A8_ECOL5|nr:hypothetical protein ECP_3786 [Escherichia coli 536]
MIICSAIIPNKTIIFKMFLPIDKQHMIGFTYHKGENDRVKRSKTIFIVLVMTKNMLFPEMSDLFMKICRSVFDYYHCYISTIQFIFHN